MRKLVRAFCHTYLIDNKSRPLKLRPLQEDIVIKSLTYPKDSNQRKLAILAPRGSGKSFALSVAVAVYMFFNRFRDLIFILAPTEDQAALIFNYVYRHFADNKFLDSLVEGYRFHNKPNITLKGGTIMRRAPLAPTNQGQAIRGQHPTFLIVDESPLIDDKLFVDNVEPAIVSNKAPFINLGTPKSKDNHMWRYLYDDNYTETFTRLHYTWRDAVKPGDAYAAPYTEEEMLDKMTEWGEDSIHWRTEYECEFVESVSNVFNPEKVKRCCDDYQLIKSMEKTEGREAVILLLLLTLANLSILLLLVHGVLKSLLPKILLDLYTLKKFLLELVDTIFHTNVNVLWILLVLLVPTKLLLMLLELVAQSNKTSGGRV